MGEKMFDDLKSLKSIGIGLNELNNIDVLCLPENFSGEVTEDLIDAQSSINLIKILRAKDIRCENFHSLGYEVPILERRGSDLWFGQIYIFNDVVLPIVLSVLSDLVMPLVNHKKVKIDKRTPTGKVKTEIFIKKGEDVTKIDFKGDAETLVKILDSLKL